MTQKGDTSSHRKENTAVSWGSRRSHKAGSEKCQTLHRHNTKQSPLLPFRVSQADLAWTQQARLGSQGRAISQGGRQQ